MSNRHITKLKKTVVIILVACAILLPFELVVYYFDQRNDRQEIVHNNTKLYNKLQVSYNYASLYVSQTMEAAYKTQDLVKINSFYYSKYSKNEIDNSVLNLSSQLEVIPNIHSAFAYNGYINNIVEIFNYGEENNDTGLKELFRIQKHNLSSMKPILRSIKENNQTKYVVSFFYFNTTADEDRINSALVINLNLDWLLALSEQIRTIENKDQEKLIIFSRQTGFIWSDAIEEQFKSELTKEYYRYNQNSATYRLEDGFSVNLFGTEYLATPYTLDKLNIDIVSVQRYENIFSHKNMVYFIFICILIIILILCGVILFIIKLKNLDVNTESSLNDVVIKAPFSAGGKEENDLIGDFHIKQLLREGTGKYSSLPEYLVDASTYKQVLMLNIKDYAAFAKNQKPYELQAYKYGVINIMEELIGDHYTKYSFDLGNQEITFVLVADAEYTINKLIETIKLAKQYIYEHLSLTVTAVLSNSSNNYLDLNALYNQCFSCMRYCYVLGASEVITADHPAIQEANSEFEYPQKLEDDLINNIKISKFSNAEEIVELMIDKIRTFTPENVNLSVIRLITAFGNAIEKNHSVALTTESIKNAKMMFSYLLSFETIDELHFELRKILLKLTIAKNKNEDSKYEKLAKDIERYIKENYSESELSVSTISNVFNMSPEYIGKIFKTQIGYPLPQYIIEIRIHKAMELLKKSRLTVAQVAERVGIPNVNYFFKVFKQQAGLTPRQYVSEYRAEIEETKIKENSDNE